MVGAPALCFIIIIIMSPRFFFIQRIFAHSRRAKDRNDAENQIHPSINSLSPSLPVIISNTSLTPSLSQSFIHSYFLFISLSLSLHPSTRHPLSTSLSFLPLFPFPTYHLRPPLSLPLLLSLPLSHPLSRSLRLSISHLLPRPFSPVHLLRSTD